MDNESQSEVLFRKTRQRFLIVKNLPLSLRTNDLFSLLENFHIDVFQTKHRGFILVMTFSGVLRAYALLRLLTNQILKNLYVF